MSQNLEVIKRCMVTLMVMILVLTFIMNVNASIINKKINSGLDVKKCISLCIKDLKNISKECDFDLSTNLKKCRTDYSYCLKSAKDSTNRTQTRFNIKNCSSTFNDCRSLAFSVKNDCKNSITQSCNNKCINPITSKDNNVNSDGKINCNWMPYIDNNGCYTIFGEIKTVIGCASGDRELGFYFDGNKCRTASGFGTNGKFTLFKSLDECEQKCLIIKPMEDLNNISNTIDLNDSINQFGFELYNRYKDDPDYTGKNIFFSPYSIDTALSMAYEGAKGKTADEMQTVLHVPKNDYERRSGFAYLNNQLNEPGKNYTLNTANALWTEKTYPFLKDYMNIILDYYKGKATNLDFINNPENSRKTINNWVENQTNNKIVDLIPQGAINPDTRLVITNAIYFKGKWALEFNKDYTNERDFTLENNKPVKVQMMSSLHRTYNYFETDDLQVLELPYSGDDLSMLILLPRVNDISIAENYLTKEKIDLIRKSLVNQEVDVYLPKFKFETQYSMKDTLKQRGIKDAFNPDSANFSGIDGSNNLSISEVVHKAYIDVNEEGTEAAAATGVIMIITTSLSPRIYVDHPFVFLIQDKRSGIILFIGRVSNPSN